MDILYLIPNLLVKFEIFPLSNRLANSRIQSVMFPIKYGPHPTSINPILLIGFVLARTFHPTLS